MFLMAPAAELSAERQFSLTFSIRESPQAEHPEAVIVAEVQPQLVDYVRPSADIFLDLLVHSY